jgi:hypothetical protein
MGIKLSLKTVNLMIFIPFDKWVQIINSLQRFKSLISKLRIFEKLCVAAQAKRLAAADVSLISNK